MQDSRGSVWTGMFFVDCTWHKEEKEFTAVGSRETQCFLPHVNQNEHMPSNFLWPMSRRVFIANLKAYKKVKAGTSFSPLSLHGKIIKGKHCML